MLSYIEELVRANCLNREELHGRFRVLVIATHPIQYQAPLYRALSHKIDLTVAFCSDFGLREYKDEGFGRSVKWDSDLTGGYEHLFVKNYSPLPNQSKFFGLINPGLFQIVARRNWDAVWIHGWANLSYWIAFLSCFVLGIPVILRGETQNLVDARGAKKILKKAVLRTLFRRISYFLAIGKHGREFFLEYGVPSDKVGIAPYTVDNEFFQRLSSQCGPQRDKVRQELGILPDQCVFIFCGKLIAKKQPGLLLEAFARLPRPDKGFLLYVGDGELRSNLERRIADLGLGNVSIQGFKNQTELPRFLTASDVFVLPSRFEPWGLVVNEAMNAKLPVIASNMVGASGDLVEEGCNGFVVPHDDVRKWSEAMGWMLENPTQRVMMGEHSLEKISKWSYSEVVDAVVGCLEVITQKRRGGRTS